MQTSIFLWGEPPAKALASQDYAKAWLTREATSRSSILRSLIDIGPNGWSGRTSPASCHRTEDGTLAPSSGGLGELGYGFAYRVLDAQYVRVDGFGRAVPQRRRRVFVVGYLGDWRRAAAVLFEPESLSWNSAPRRQAGQAVAPTISARPTGGGGLGTDFDCDGGLVPDISHTLLAKSNDSFDDTLQCYVASHDPAVTLTARDYKGPLPEADLSTIVAHALRAEGFDASEDGTGRGTPIAPIVADTLTAYWERSKGAKAGNQVGLINPIIEPIAIQERAVCESVDAGPDGVGVRDDGAAYTLEARTTPQAVQSGWAVRRLVPDECERLQGFPDGYTQIPVRGKPAADGPRYKALGNSMAVNAMRWLGRRIELVKRLCHATEEKSR